MKLNTVTQEDSRELHSKRRKISVKGSFLVTIFLFALFSLVRKRPTAVETLAATPSEDNLRMDYEQTNDQVRTLTDIRFKLLAFVPTLTAAAVALLTNATLAPGTGLVVGLLGFVVTLAITIYDQRNSQIYDTFIHRAKELEKKLNLPPSTKGTKLHEGGLWNERPKRTVRLLGLLAWHDRALAMVYSTALGGWVYIIATSVLSALSPFLHWPEFLLLNHPINGFLLASILIAIFITFLFIWQFHDIEAKREKPAPYKP